MSSVIPAGKIEVIDPPEIRSLQLINQIIENVGAQISLLDAELYSAQTRDSSGKLKDFYENVHEIKINAETARSVISAIDIDSSKSEGINVGIEGHSDLIAKVRDASAALKELENELTAGEADYYRIIAELLVNAQQQMAYFDVYTSIPHVKLMNDKLRAIQSEIKRQVQWSFREIGQLVVQESIGFDEFDGSSAQQSDLSSLNRIYIVVDAIGTQFRTDLLDRFAQLQLIPYEKLFSYGNKLSSLDNLDKRFAWFKKLLSAVDHRLSTYIPSRWGLQYHLFAEFIRRTRKHLIDVMNHMEKSYGDVQSHVQALLKAVRAVVVFEAEMKASFAVSARGLEDFEEHQTPSTSVTPSATAANVVSASTAGSNSDYLVNLISEVNIATAFDAFLNPYIQLEKDELDKLMERVMREEDAGTLVEEDGVRKQRDPFTSVKKMFDYIKKSLNRCTGYSTGATYISLSKEFCIVMHHYAESLKFRCPSPTAVKPGKPPVYVNSPEKEAAMFTIITTSEYVNDVILPTLEALMKKNAQPSYLNEIDFTTVTESFEDVISYTFNILAQGIVERLDGSFKKMRQTNWAAIDDVGDDSPYCKEIYSTLSEVIVRARNALSTAYFQQFAMKLVTVVLETLLDSIWKLKRIAKTGAGQLLLDLNGIKEYLLAMPNKRLEVGHERIQISKAYSQIVNDKIHNIQIILKLVCTDDDKLNETFTDLWPDGKQSDLDAVIALKAKAGILAPVGDVILDGALGVGRGAKTAVDGAKNVMVGGVGGAVGGAKSAVGQAVGGFTSAFGEFSTAMFTGSMFGDDALPNAQQQAHASKHDQARKGEHIASSTAAAPSSATKKGVLTGVGAAFGFASVTKK